MLTNPPFGDDWKKMREFVENECEEKGFNGRFGAGTPDVSDGSFLFLQHMISKMNPKGALLVLCLMVLHCLMAMQEAGGAISVGG